MGGVRVGAGRGRGRVRGYGPWRLARVLRLRRIVALAASEPGAGLARIAHGAGYADQSHLSHECRDLAGVAASALLAG